MNPLRWRVRHYWPVTLTVMATAVTALQFLPASCGWPYAVAGWAFALGMSATYVLVMLHEFGALCERCGTEPDNAAARVGQPAVGRMLRWAHFALVSGRAVVSYGVVLVLLAAGMVTPRGVGQWLSAVAMALLVINLWAWRTHCRYELSCPWCWRGGGNGGGEHSPVPVPQQPQSV